jgi:hypothetical protein
MANPSEEPLEQKRMRETLAVLNIWRRHRESDDESMLAFAEWTMNHRDVVTAELEAEMAGLASESAVKSS